MVTLYLLLGTVLVLMLAAGLSTLIGTRIPKEHDCEVEGRFPHPIETLWDLISDVAAHDQWRKLVKKVEVEEAGKTFRLSYVANPVATRLEIQLMESPHRLVWNAVDIDGPVHTVWTLELEAQERDCLLHIHENATIDNPWYRFVLKYITGNDKLLKDFFADLKSKLTPSE